MDVLIRFIVFSLNSVHYFIQYLPTSISISSSRMMPVNIIDSQHQLFTAAQFYQRFESVQSSAFADLVHTLSRVTTPVHMHANELVDTIR
jgi:hypothetical protein